jgi:hypothetical protein
MRQKTSSETTPLWLKMANSCREEGREVAGDHRQDSRTFRNRQNRHARAAQGALLPGGGAIA